MRAVTLPRPFLHVNACATVLSADLCKGHMKKIEMGAVLWLILALMFVLVSLPNASREEHAGGYYNELLLPARGHGRRARSSEDDDIASAGTINPTARGWSCEQCRQNGSRYNDTLEEGFLTGIKESVQSVFQQFTGPLLVHAVRLYNKG